MRCTKVGLVALCLVMLACDARNASAADPADRPLGPTTALPVRSPGPGLLGIGGLNGNNAGTGAGGGVCKPNDSCTMPPAPERVMIRITARVRGVSFDAAQPDLEQVTLQTIIVTCVHGAWQGGCTDNAIVKLPLRKGTVNLATDGETTVELMREVEAPAGGCSVVRKESAVDGWKILRGRNWGILPFPTSSYEHGTGCSETVLHTRWMLLPPEELMDAAIAKNVALKNIELPPAPPSEASIVTPVK